MENADNNARESAPLAGSVLFEKLVTALYNKNPRSPLLFRFASYKIRDKQLEEARLILEEGQAYFPHHPLISILLAQTTPKTEAVQLDQILESPESVLQPATLTRAEIGFSFDSPADTPVIITTAAAEAEHGLSFEPKTEETLPSTITESAQIEPPPKSAAETEPIPKPPLPPCPYPYVTVSLAQLLEDKKIYNDAIIVYLHLQEKFPERSPEFAKKISELSSKIPVP